MSPFIHPLVLQALQDPRITERHWEMFLRDPDRVLGRDCWRSTPIGNVPEGWFGRDFVLEGDSVFYLAQGKEESRRQSLNSQKIGRGLTARHLVGSIYQFCVIADVYAAVRRDGNGDTVVFRNGNFGPFSQVEHLQEQDGRVLYAGRHQTLWGIFLDHRQLQMVQGEVIFLAWSKRESEPLFVYRPNHAPDQMRLMVGGREIDRAPRIVCVQQFEEGNCIGYAKLCEEGRWQICVRVANNLDSFWTGPFGGEIEQLSFGSHPYTSIFLHEKREVWVGDQPKYHHFNIEQVMWSPEGQVVWVGAERQGEETTYRVNYVADGAMVRTEPYPLIKSLQMVEGKPLFWTKVAGSNRVQVVHGMDLGPKHDEIFSLHVEGDQIVYGARNGRQLVRMSRPVSAPKNEE